MNSFMSRLKTDDVTATFWRLQDVLRAQKALNECAQYLHAGRAPAALRSIRCAKKSVQGAVRHARARHSEAERAARTGCNDFYEGSMGRCVNCNLQKSAHKVVKP